MKNKSWKELAQELEGDTLTTFLKGIFNRTEVTDRRIITYQRCLTHGWVSRGGDEDKICNDPQCGSCRMWSKVLEEALSEFKTNDTNTNG